jgi:WD40 repeat protein
LNDLRFTPDGHQLAVANRNLTLVSIDQPRAIQVLRDDQANYGTARFTADGHAVLVITGRGAIQVIDAATGRTKTNMCCSTIYGEVAFSPDETLIFNAGHWPGIWRSQSGGLVTRLTKAREFEAFGPVAFDVSRSLVYMGSQDGRVYAWDTATRQLRTTSPSQPGYVNTISVVGTTGWVAYAAFGGAVRVWNPDTGEAREIAAARTTSNLLFDASGNLMLLGTNEGNIEAWDLLKGKIQQSVTCGAR